MVHFDQDPVVMTFDLEPKGCTISIAEEEKEREEIKGNKAKRSSNTKK